MDHYRLVGIKNKSLFVYPEDIVDDKLSMVHRLMPVGNKVKWKRELSTDHIEDEIWLDKYSDLAELDTLKLVRRVDKIIKMGGTNA